MDTLNLAERYAAPPIAWSEVTGLVDAGYAQATVDAGPGRHTCWLTSLNADGSPHTNAVGGLWRDASFWFVTGLSTRRGRNLARDPRCTLALSLRELDLVVEGRAALVTDPADLTELAALWNAEGWPCELDPTAEPGPALTAPFSAQSAGGPPWHVFRLVAASAHAVQTVEPHGATRWRF
ncbi:pyridoxamine 5'-phosphate oxidase family protein [Nocardioides sp. WV_118_6]|uniref:pyridoxamine 5'-phosphate oxidase family protein n=1 Tax=Nocardioides simplex TaxID=2045 RepID=UPI00214F757E|nr:pyridoxamine 5'-phosphate oxidase family protein [Pimelobacter simplex]UUW90690.1 pyridoxamine 5'-phosphate oxidase family protein [Pimelobacter simplex]UUW94519.1 pyridoxamine 5'-phosphate oxidase family protein [Pimelobacter simplex]